MKQKISVTIDKEKIKELDRVLEEGKFRNKSHIIELGLEKMLLEKMSLI
tara:strand:+ start:499 stop:645 length:147 start_codon:yes stop_codon:yes gene_type:complete